MSWTEFASTSILIVALTSTGCATLPETRFYALSASPASSLRQTSSEMQLAIGPIDLPEYLQRPQIVTRPEDNRLEVDEFNRWGGPLEEEIDRVLAKNLGNLVGTQSIYSYPSRVVAGIDYRISLYVRSFDGALGNTVTFDVSWSIVNEKSAQVLRTNQGHYQAVMQDGSYGSYATALSDTLQQLSRDLANDLAAASQ